MLELLPYLVEAMNLADIGQVMEIEQTSFSAPWPARAYRYEIVTNKHSTMLVVRPAAMPLLSPRKLLRHFKLFKPGIVLGYAGSWLLVDEIHVSTIAVHANWRGRGLGELLLLSLLERAVSSVALRATLEVRVSNVAAQGLYHKYGFDVVSRQKRYYSDNNEDAFIMSTLPFEKPEFQDNLQRCRSHLYARLKSGQAETSRLIQEPQIRG
jgi:ribosomal-protein-alanine N-acetyltransferase